MKLAGDRGTPASGGRDQAPEMLATSPIIRQSGRKKAVLARYVHNGRLLDALGGRAFAATTRSPGARGLGHRAALRQLANRQVGILLGCVKSPTKYNDVTAWSLHTRQDQRTAA